MKRTWIAKLGIALASILAAFGIAELAVRWWVPVRNVGPSFTVYDSTYGKRLKRNFHATRHTPEFSMSFTTNALGFRGPEFDATPERPLLLLGDSYTMGYGVNDGEDFPALIREAFAARGIQIPVINAGMGDNGNGYWVKFLRNEGSHLNPRLVVLQLSVTDFGDNLKERLFTLTASGNLAENPVPAPGWPRVVQELIETVPGLSYSYLVGLLRQALPRAGVTSPVESDSGARTAGSGMNGGDSLTYRLVSKTLDLCERKHWPVIALAVAIEEKRLVELRRLFRPRAITLIEVPGRSGLPDLYYPIDGHWNARGHRWVAERLLEHLEAAAAWKDR